MHESELGPETQLAIARCVRSIEDVEVLLYLARHAARYSSADTVSAETGLPVRAAAAALEALASRNLLDVRIAEAVLYKLDPASADARAMVDRTLDAARSNRTLVLRAILAGASAAHDFADAFRVTRKRRSNA
jgi:hypothetical protein